MRRVSDIAEKCLSNPDWLHDKYITHKNTTREIATELGVDHGTVIARLKNCNISRRPNHTIPHDMPEREQLVELYETQHKTLIELSEIFQMSAETIRRWIKYYNIKIRPMGDWNRGKPRSSEQRLKISHANKGKFHYWQKGIPLGELQKRHISEAQRLEKHWNWRGGVSFGNYCPKFNNALKEEIREAFGRKCFLCNIPENGHRLSIHHVDFNKGQGCGQRWSLLPLCKSCHSKTGMRRHYYFNLLSNYWIMECAEVVSCHDFYI